MKKKLEPQWSELRSHLTRLQRAALDAADPAEAVKRHLDWREGELSIGTQSFELDPKTRLFLIAIGKASTAMARGALEVLGLRVGQAIVVHPKGETDTVISTPSLTRYPGAHPLPDSTSLAAGRAIEALLAETTEDDVVLVLISGGASAMVESPIEGVGLEAIAAATLALQKAGCGIHDLNIFRRAASKLKGGGMLRLARPARVAALLLSDVVGDDPATIASGPVVPSPTNARDALHVLERYQLIDPFPEIVRAMRSADLQLVAPAESVAIVGSNSLAALAACSAATDLGFYAQVVTNALEGDAREAGRMIASAALRVRETREPLAPPACLIFGGETTVTVRGSGRGGRNHELALAAAMSLDGASQTAVFSFATDGVDGTSDGAGAVATGSTVSSARAAGLSPVHFLADNDSGNFFARLGDSYVTGPSGTNVNDLAIALIY